MQLTRAEAEEKWCPMVKGVNGCTHTFAGGLENVPNVCISDRCMMWRWTGTGVGCCGLAWSPVN